MRQKELSQTMCDELTVLQAQFRTAFAKLLEETSWKVEGADVCLSAER
jgi:hypothetical protein